MTAKQKTSAALLLRRNIIATALAACLVLTSLPSHASMATALEKIWLKIVSNTPEGPLARGASKVLTKASKADLQLILEFAGMARRTGTAKNIDLAESLEALVKRANYDELSKADEDFIHNLITIHIPKTAARKLAQQTLERRKKVYTIIKRLSDEAAITAHNNADESKALIYKSLSKKIKLQKDFSKEEKIHAIALIKKYNQRTANKSVNIEESTKVDSLVKANNVNNINVNGKTANTNKVNSTSLIIEKNIVENPSSDSTLRHKPLDDNLTVSSKNAAPIFEHLSDEQKAIFKSFESISSGASGVSKPSRISGLHIVDPGVKRFIRDFTDGANKPHSTFDNLDADYMAHIKKWLKAPQAKRIFIVGSGEDLGLINTLRDTLNTQGFEVFFYKYCRENSGALCRAQVVGAFHQTAGTTLFADTRAAMSSKYVVYELETIKRIREGRAMVVTVSTTHIRQASIAAGAIARFSFVVSLEQGSEYARTEPVTADE